MRPSIIPDTWREVSKEELAAAIAQASAAPAPEGCKDVMIWLGGVSAIGHPGKTFLRPGDFMVNVVYVMDAAERE